MTAWKPVFAMKRFFIDLESGSTRRRAGRWEVLPQEPLHDTSYPAHHFDRGHNTRSRRGRRSSLGTDVADRFDEHAQAVIGTYNFGQLADRLVQDLPASQSPLGAAELRDDSVMCGLKLTIAMAAHNEHRTIAEAITQVLEIQLACDIELIVVDDGSTDGTLEIIRTFDDPRLTVIVHPTCMGKGASVLDAANAATGTHLLVFDADLEYSASDIAVVVEPVLNGVTSVVYGTRVRGSRSFAQSLIYGVGSRVTTALTNLIYKSQLKDMHTCLKLIPLSIFRQLKLSNPGFGLDTEISCELVRRKIQPYEVAVSYQARSVAQGKQINIQDGIECLKIIIQVRLRRRESLRNEPQESTEAFLSASVAE
jgi:hypothetical protein